MIKSAENSPINNHDKHARSLRKGRWSASGQIYHVTTRCYRGNTIFHNPLFAQYLMDEINCSDAIECSKTAAFVVMPDHLHWLFELKEKLPLEKLIGQVKGRTAKHINQQRQDNSQIWQPGYYDRALRTHENVEAVAMYVINNPVRAGLASTAADYPFLKSIY